ncbi:MAG: GGDEF domain-containing protein [Clostridiales bacterium]|jgi:diguanylate cyclase (GGDEF)-like protein|nr:GGDEF domain-containing protein [Clostridiales bacterium]
MDQFSNLYNKWRKKLNNAALIIAIFTLLLEIIVSHLMYRFLPEMIGLSIPKYVLLYIILPSSSYFLLVVIGRYINNSIALSETMKNYFSILIITCQLFIIACVHNVFIFTSILYVIPIILTVIYSKKTMTNVVTLISIIFMLISSFVAVTDAQTNDIFHTLEVFIGVLLILGCSILTNLLTDIEKDKNNIVKAGAFKQLQLEELIKCDPLTGLYNIASFYNTLDAAIKKDEMPLTLAVIDIDNFKAVNDAWGHDNANEVLIFIAAQLQYCCSTQGHVFRYGGEEFTIVFPKTSPTHAKTMIEAAQKNIYNHDFGHNPKLNISFSCGIAAYPSLDFNAHDLFQLADKIMYQAKFSGKNKILIGTPLSSTIDINNA